MAFSLAPFVGDGSDLSPFRPDVTGLFSVIDLRPDSTQTQGRCLVMADTVPSGALGLGDLLDENMPRGVSRNLENTLGITLDQTNRLRAIITELLLLHGDDRPQGTRTRWRPIKPTRDGINRIVMGEEVIFEAPVVQGAIVSDDFNRPDETLATSADWTHVINGGGTLDVTSNALVSNSTGSDEVYRFEQVLDSADHYSQIVRTSISFTNRQHRVMARYSHPFTDTFYAYRYRHNGDRTLEKSVSGSVTSIASTTLSALTSPITHRIEVDGSNIRGLIDGDVELQTTDSEITGNLRVGIGTIHPNITMDDFEGGDLAAEPGQVIPVRYAGSV